MKIIIATLILVKIIFLTAIVKGYSNDTTINLTNEIVVEGQSYEYVIPNCKPNSNTLVELTFKFRPDTMIKREKNTFRIDGNYYCNDVYGRIQCDKIDNDIWTFQKQLIVTSNNLGFIKITINIENCSTVAYDNAPSVGGKYQNSSYIKVNYDKIVRFNGYKILDLGNLVLTEGGKANIIVDDIKPNSDYIIDYRASIAPEKDLGVRPTFRVDGYISFGKSSISFQSITNASWIHYYKKVAIGNTEGDFINVEFNVTDSGANPPGKVNSKFDQNSAVVIYYVKK